MCGHIWNPVARRLLRRGCPKCCSPKGEKKIEKILLENNIEFKSQYSFPDLRGGIGKNGFLRYDFAIFQEKKFSHLIEYDGMQHFKPIKYLGGERRFKRQRELDNMKNEYCIKNNIKLIRISHKDYSKINLEMLIK